MNNEEKIKLIGEKSLSLLSAFISNHNRGIGPTGVNNEDSLDGVVYIVYCMPNESFCSMDIPNLTFSNNQGNIIYIDVREFAKGLVAGDPMYLEILFAGNMSMTNNFFIFMKNKQMFVTKRYAYRLLKLIETILDTISTKMSVYKSKSEKILKSRPEDFFTMITPKRVCKFDDIISVGDMFAFKKISNNYYKFTISKGKSPFVSIPVAVNSETKSVVLKESVEDFSDPTGIIHFDSDGFFKSYDARLEKIADTMFSQMNKPKLLMDIKKQTVLIQYYKKLLLDIIESPINFTHDIDKTSSAVIRQVYGLDFADIISINNLVRDKLPRMRESIEKSKNIEEDSCVDLVNKMLSATISKKLILV